MLVVVQEDLPTRVARAGSVPSSGSVALPGQEIGLARRVAACRWRATRIVGVRRRDCPRRSDRRRRGGEATAIAHSQRRGTDRGSRVGVADGGDGRRRGRAVAEIPEPGQRVAGIGIAAGAAVEIDPQRHAAETWRGGQRGGRRHYSPRSCSRCGGPRRPRRRWCSRAPASRRRPIPGTEAQVDRAAAAEAGHELAARPGAGGRLRAGRSCRRHSRRRGSAPVYRRRARRHSARTRRR